MTPFMLVFTLFTGEYAEPFVTVIDYNLTAEDCIAAMVAMESEAIELGGFIACEFDYAHN